MDINGIGSGASLAATAKRTHRPDGDADEVARAASPGMSAIAQDMNQLRTLQQDDPEKFKAVMAEIAAAMKELADAQPQNGALGKLAGEFQQAAETGQMPALGGKGGHHHPKHAPEKPDDAAKPATVTGVAAYAKADRESAWQAVEKAISDALTKVGP